MILYNMREKGPFEYDKSILNVMQFYNEIANILDTEFDTNSNFDTITDFANEVNKFYKFVVGDDTNIGASQQLYFELLHYKEC